jgi:threonine dehydratase
MIITIPDIEIAYQKINPVVKHTPLQRNDRLSNRYNANIYLKREDLQVVRSYKIRGAYNLIMQLTNEQRAQGVVCASAGNHAQGVAYACARLQVHGIVYMPETTPLQKINRVRKFGGDFVEIRLIGSSYDEACSIAFDFCSEQQLTFVHPFDDERTIAGQATVAKEISWDFPEVEVVVAPVGGGGLVAGLVSYFKQTKPGVRIIGIEAAGAPKLTEALRAGRPVTLPKIDTFVDGAAVKRIGEKTFAILQNQLDAVYTVPEGKICTDMIDLYQEDGIIAEPAGALSISGLDEIAEEIRGLNVACIISGGNNDLMRYPEILERSLIYKGLKHYFLIEFAQKPGQLRRYLDECLVENSDIVLFEYIKKTNKESGPALVGIELQQRPDFDRLVANMDRANIRYKVINPNDDILYNFII